MRTVFEQLAQDLRYGVRGLRRSRAFLMTTVLTLAVGVGLLAVAFTVVNAYVLRPYAVRDPQLEKAIEVVLAELKKNPPAKIVRPAYPIRGKTQRGTVPNGGK